MGTDFALELTNISKRFGPTQALNRVHLRLKPGEVHSLIGENGSGKSTLMKIVAADHQPDSGEMLLEGQPYRPHSPAHARRLGVSMIHQELSICRHLSVRDNVLLGIESTALGWVSKRESEKRVRDALQQVGLGSVDINRMGGEFAIGTQQLMEIARALVLKSKVVILDEPTSSLTEADAIKLFEIIRSLKTQGTAVVFISHFLNEVRAVSDQITVLRDGDYIASKTMGEVTDRDIVTLMVGREIEDLYPRSDRNVGPVLLEASSLEGTKLPTWANLKLHAGEVLGIAGLNGSGRTELLRVLFSLDPVKSGTVKVGEYSSRATPGLRWSQKVGFLSEDRKSEGLAIRLSISDNIHLSSLPKGFLTTAQLESSSEKWMQAVQVKAEGPSQPVNRLSGGNQQKVAIARLLKSEVQVLLLDEPTRGIDVGSKAQIYRLINEAAQAGKAVILVSSYLPELLGVCDRIGVMNRGVLQPFSAVSDLTQEILMHQAVAENPMRV